MFLGVQRHHFPKRLAGFRKHRYIEPRIQCSSVSFLQPFTANRFVIALIGASYLPSISRVNSAVFHAPQDHCRAYRAEARQ